MWNIGLWLVAVIVVGISGWVYKWRNPKCKGVLPPGSMGLPFIGESIQYFSSHSYEGIPPFIAERTARYGGLFKTSILGQPVVISTDPEINYYVFQQENNLFQCWYTKSASDLLGEQGLNVHGGAVHKYLRNLVLSLVGQQCLKGNLMSEIDLITRKHLDRWAEHGKVEVKEAAEIMLFTFMAKKTLGCEEQEALELREHYKAFFGGFLSFPLNVPGTAYHACLQGRKNIVKVIRDILKKRQSSKEKANQDFLDHMLKEVENEESLLTEEIIVDLVLLLLFAAYETTSSSITLLFKYLNSHPEVLTELTEEHESILKSRTDEGALISWLEYKSMSFTNMVINETVRLANIAPGIFRITLKDVQIKVLLLQYFGAMPVKLDKKRVAIAFCYLTSRNGRKNIVKVIKDILKKRQSSKEKANQDFLDHMLKEVENEESLLTAEIIVDLVLLLLFAAYETTSSSITLLFKYLNSHPEVLTELTEEHESILKRRTDEGALISWL
ncbi:cytochrome P450 87A3-like [Nicotiana tabacum]|uniref:Cytochrome P450 87A3-like n=1 Tax=Nicotiana tabacum TaxID=4097 RepID=A0AC58T3T3_TOBAC